METEIKLLLPPERRAAAAAHPAFAGVEPTISHDLSTYYDTPDLALRRRGVSLRVRRSGDRRVQTVKRRDAGRDFASRGEWEWPVAGDALDRAAIAADAEAGRALGGDLDRVAPVFTTEVARETRLVSVEAGTMVEVSFDAGEVRAGERRAALSEVELELKAGAPGPLLRLAADLSRAHGLRFGPDSKAERGYGLLTEELPPHPGTTDLALPEGVTLGEAMPLMVAAGARDFAADLTAAARGDVEGIHRLRAAIRKLRTLFVLFAPFLEREAAARFNGELRAFGRVLGAGRDWDVFLTETLADAEAELGTATVAPLRARAALHDREAHAAVTAAITGPAPTDLLLGLSLWTCGRAWLRDADEAAVDAPLGDVLPGLLDRLERKASKRGRRLAKRAPGELHDLRKALKKLRYACEDVASLFDARPVADYVGRVKKVLADLGRINDAAVTTERLADLGRDGDPAVARAAEALARWNAARGRSAARELRRRWRRLRHAEPFWS